jgi:hypothetical protein
MIIVVSLPRLRSRCTLGSPLTHAASPDALAFEPILRLLAGVGRRVHFLAKMGDAMAASMERVAAHYGVAPRVRSRWS